MAVRLATQSPRHAASLTSRESAGTNRYVGERKYLKIVFSKVRK